MIELRKITKKYGNNVIFNDMSVTFDKKSTIYAILGNSGAGKSTLFNILFGIDQEYTGEYLLSKKNVKKFKNIDWDNSRNNDIQIVYQDFKLIESDTRAVVVPYKDDSVDVNALINRLRAGERNKELLQRIQPFSVNVYQRDYVLLYGMGLIEPFDEEIAILSNMNRYSEFMGLTIPVTNGTAIFA
jgi:ABC-type lipoprotein export system ATPase subunit